MTDAEKIAKLKEALSWTLCELYGLQKYMERPEAGEWGVECSVCRNEWFGTGRQDDARRLSRFAEPDLRRNGAEPMTVADEIRDMKADQIAAMINSDVLLIERCGPRYVVHQWMDEGVAPQSSYATKEQAAARALQLLGITDPVAPQHWPETVCIGEITTEK